MLPQQSFGHVTSPPAPSSNQADLLGMSTGGQDFLQAPLEPTDAITQQDTLRAIQDLQLLLVPPGGDGTDNNIPKTTPQMIRLQPPEHIEPTHEAQVATEGTVEGDNESILAGEQFPHQGGSESVSPQPQSEVAMPPTWGEEVTMEVTMPPTRGNEETLPPTRGEETFPTTRGEETFPPTRGEEEASTDTGPALPDVLQVLLL